MIYLNGIYFFVLSAAIFADILSTYNSPRFNLSLIIFLIQLLQILQKYHSVILYLSLKQYSFLQRKSSMHYVGQYLGIVKAVSLCLHVASNLALLEKKFYARIFRQPQECGARLVAVTNQPVPRPSTTFFAFSQAKYFFLFN